MTDNIIDYYVAYVADAFNSAQDAMNALNDGTVKDGDAYYSTSKEDVSNFVKENNNGALYFITGFDDKNNIVYESKWPSE